MSHPEVICYQCHETYQPGDLKNGLCYHCDPNKLARLATAKRAPLTTKRVRIVDPIGTQLDDYVVLQRGKKRFRITLEEIWDLHEKYPEIG